MYCVYYGYVKINTEFSLWSESALGKENSENIFLAFILLHKVIAAFQLK